VLLKVVFPAVELIQLIVNI